MWKGFMRFLSHQSNCMMCGSLCCVAIWVWGLLWVQPKGIHSGGTKSQGEGLTSGRAMGSAGARYHQLSSTWPWSSLSFGFPLSIAGSHMNRQWSWPGVMSSAEDQCFLEVIIPIMSNILVVLQDLQKSSTITCLPNINLCSTLARLLEFC